MAHHQQWNDADSSDEGGGSVLWAVWRRKWIVVCVAAMATGAAYFYYLKSPPVYQSDAQILLMGKGADLPLEGVESPDTYRQDTLGNHLLLLRSPKILQPAVEKHDLGSLKSLYGKGDPVAVVRGGLTVDRASKPGDTSNVISLSYVGLDAEDCRKILDAVIKTYEEFLSQEHRNLSTDTVQLITRANDELHKQLTEKRAAYRKFRQETPLLWSGEQGSNLHESRLHEIEAARGEVLVENAQAKARIGAIEAAMKDGSRESLLLLATAAMESKGDQTVSPRSGLEEAIFSTVMEEQMLLEDYGPDHPKVKAVRKKMDLIREHLGAGATSEEKKDLLAVYLESLQQELKVGEEKLRELDSLFVKEREAAKAMADFQDTDRDYRDEISRLQVMFDAVVKRLDEISLVNDKDYGGVSLQVISPPSSAWQVQPNLANNLLIGGILGMLAGFMLAFLVDRADRRFRSPEEIRRQLGVPVLGHIPTIAPTRRQLAAQRRDPVRSRVAPVLTTFLQPESPTAEAYRGLRTSLLYSARRSDYRIVQVTSAHPGEGKTTLAANLAISVAQSGKRVLLVDADFRRPKVAKVFGLDDSSGLATVLNGQSELCDSVRETPIVGLWALPCGPLPANPAELLSSAEFTELLDVLREQYDFVIIDTPPLLPVSDPAIVASHADTVILVMRLTKGARDAVIQATEILAGLDAEMLGVVVNGVGSGKPYGGKRTHFRHGQYRYGAGSRYGYGYSQSYGSDGQEVESGATAPREELMADGSYDRPRGERAGHARR